MIKNTRMFSGFTIFFWSTLIIELIILELTSINITTMLVPLIVSTVGTIALLVIFVLDYRKSKPNVAKLKNEYLESLKPKQPLRFCASDDELLKAYKASASEISIKQSAKQTSDSKQIDKPKAEKGSEEEVSM